jgi:hypothetical protein
MVAMLDKCALNSKSITISVISKATPHHHSSSSMLHGGNHTCRNNPFTYDASHEDTTVGSKNVKFGHIRPKDRFPPVYCPLLVFLGPSKSLLLRKIQSIGVGNVL